MATIAIGDVHGNLLALDDLLGQLRREVAGDDTVVFLGDYIDRGPDSKGCVDAILAFEREAGGEVVCLCGNHEDWMLRTLGDYGRHSWLLAMSAFPTIRSYSVEGEQTLRDAVSSDAAAVYGGRRTLPYEAFFDRMPQAHQQFFKDLRHCHRSPDCIAAHGGLDPRVPRLEDQTPHALIWGAGSFPDGYDGVEVVVYGHLNNAVLDADGWPGPKVAGRTIGIDTISHGVLTAIRLPDRRVFQSARYDVGRSDD